MMRLAVSIFWPSFMAAIAAEGFFFSMFDPHDLSLAGKHIDLPASAIYTLGFFCFWFFCSLACSLTCYLLIVPADSDAAGRAPF